MSSDFSPSGNSTQFKEFTCNCNQVAGTYTLATAGADIVIKSVSIFVATAVLGLTSLAIASNNTVPDAILATTILASLTTGKNLTPVSLPFTILSTKLLQYTIVGNGTGGTVTCIVEFGSPTGGTLS